MMIESLKEKELNIGQFLVNRNRSSVLEKLALWGRTSLFEVIMRIFPRHEQAHSSSMTKILLMYLVSSIETLQLVSLLYYPEENVRNWKSFKSFWVFLSFSRFDAICADFSLLSGCFYFSIALITFHSLLLACVFFMYFRTSAVSEFVLNFLRSIWVLLSTLFYLPILFIFAVTFKYSKVDEAYIIEYDSSDSSMARGFYQLESVFLCLLILAGYLYHSLVFECRHKFSKLSVYARSHSKLEILRFHIHTTFVILYLFLAPLNKTIYRCLISALSLYLAYSYYKLRPFFCLHTNLSRILTYSTLISFTFVLEFGSFFQNSNYSFILSVFVLPILIFNISVKLWENLKKPLGCPKSSSTMYEFELRIRSQLINPSSHQGIIEMFSEIYNKTEYGKSNAIKLWLSNFCFYTMEDDRLTRIKLGIKTQKTSSIDVEFQLFSLRKTVKTMPLEYHEDVEYIKFLAKYQNVKADDEAFCLLTKEFLVYIQGEQDCRLALDKYSERIAGKIDAVCREYKNLVEAYPQSVSAVEDFSSFFGVMLNKDDKSVERVKARNKSKVNFGFSEFKGVSFFDEKNGLIVVSADLDYFGFILYANAAAAEILEQELKDIVGNSINSYIPHPFDIKHNKYMKKYLLTCSSSEISKPLSFFIQTSSNFIKECYIRISCTALDSDPFFTVLIREQNKNREIGVLSKTNLILSHSENFPASLGQSQLSLSNSSINEHIQNYQFQDLLESHFYPLQVSSTQKVSIIKSFKAVNQKRISIIYVKPYKNRTLTLIPKVNFNQEELKDCTIYLDFEKSEKKNYFKSKKQINNLESEKIADSQNDLYSNPIKTLGSSSLTSNNTLSSIPIFQDTLKLLKKFKVFFTLMIVIIVSSNLLAR